jgi:serine/threonine protein phosphatase PrpC
MITCPECGQTAPDDAKFCDRCGQGLSRATSAPPPPPTRPSPLPAGATLKGGIEIIEVASQTSIENRYRAKRIRDGKLESRDSKIETIILRERFGPSPEIETAQEPLPETAVVPEPAAVDPNGPSAKTAELKPIAAKAQQSSGNGAAINSPAAASQAASGVRSSQAGSEGAGEGMASVAESSEPQEVPTEADSAEHDGESQHDSSESDRQGKSPDADTSESAQPSEAVASDSTAADSSPIDSSPVAEDLGEVFGRVLALSQMITHPAFQRASSGFSENGRVYLVYADEKLAPLRTGAMKGVAQMSEPDALASAIQICQAISYIHRKALRLNDICPESIAIAKDGRLKLTGLDYVSNDNELQAEPIFNDGYTAPEIYRGKRVDKRADIFSAGALLYTWLTGERIPSESWREEGGPVRFYPPHVVAPKIENAIRRAIAFNPGDRWATIDEFKAALIALSGTIRLRAAAMTDVGRVREHNEDSVLAVEYTRESMVEPAQNHLFVVADGMGGAEAGEIASAIAVEAIRNYVESGLAVNGASALSDQAASELLTGALENANSKIIEYVASHPESRGMGSTGVTALVTPSNVSVGWVGDSRAYLMEGGRIRQITRDHSLVQRLVEIGQITADEARTHEHKNVITRSLGARQSGAAGAEATTLRLKRGDILLLCSDGLTAHLEDHQLREILVRNNDPYDAARELIVAANAGGGTDNITVVVVFAS